MQLQVHDARREEVYRDIARVPEAYGVDKSGRKVAEGEVRRMTIAGKSAFVIVRGDQGATSPTIRLDDKTRDALAVRLGQVVDVQLDSPLLREWRWACNATEVGYRVASRIAVISFLLGIFGLIIGAVALCGR